MGIKRLYILRHGNAEAPTLGNDAARNFNVYGRSGSTLYGIKI